jgi:hypothetical protein
MAQAEDQIDAALSTWRQGDFTLAQTLDFVHLADLSSPLSPVAEQAAESLGGHLPNGPVPIIDEVLGIVMVSQTCDIVRSCRARPYIEVAPLVPASAPILEEIRRLKRPAFAYIPGAAGSRMVADLDRIMTVEKAVAARWPRTPGYFSDEEGRQIASAFGRKRTRFAFPDDFIEAIRPFSERLIEKHNRQSEEGAHIRALREIRVRAAPAWDAPRVALTFWFVKDAEPEGVEPEWAKMLDGWTSLIGHSGRFEVDTALAVRLRDITAEDYVESDPLDYDRLSTG